MLISFFINLLLEVTMAVEQSYRDKIQIQIAGRFAMVARENSEATRVVGNRLVKTELSRKISHWPINRSTVTGLSVGVFSSEIISKRIVHLVQVTKETFILCDID